MTDRPSPNVIIIIMDDLGWGDLACHGNPWTHTPCLDRLYSQSTRLTRYCSGPVSTPARACLMTGRYAQRTRAIDTWAGRSMMDPDEITLAELLRENGYATGIFGKWHLGDCYPMRAMDKGFDEALVHNGGGLCQPGNPGFYDGLAEYFDPQLSHNGQHRQVKGFCTDIFADAACQWIRTQKHKPFFCYLATNAPHTPLQIADQWADPYRKLGLPEAIARMYGTVANIDHNVGKVMATLDELGSADDTIVIYTSDHGPQRGLDHGSAPRWNAHQRGWKGEVYLGGIRVPCFWRYPRAIAPGRNIQHVTNPIDFLPTLASFCGFKPPADRTIDGADLSGLFTGQTPVHAWPDRTVFLQWHRGDATIFRRNCTAIAGQYKLVSTLESGSVELFDINADPLEQHDLATELPEVTADLAGQYQRWFVDVQSTRPHPDQPPRIVVGSAHEPLTYLTRQDWRIKKQAGGWLDEDTGWWLIRVAEGGKYRITVQLPEAGRQGRLEARCGGWSSQYNLDGRAAHTFENVGLHDGDATLEAFIDHEGVRRGALRVDVSRMR